MNKGERIILKDDKGKQYELIRVLDLDTKKIIDDLSALVVKKDKIIDWLVEEIKELKKLNIENEKTYTQLGEIIGEKKVEDKIKEKVIEIKNKPVKDEFITASQGKLDTIIEMESLLERK